MQWLLSWSSFCRRLRLFGARMLDRRGDIGACWRCCHCRGHAWRQRGSEAATAKVLGCWKLASSAFEESVAAFASGEVGRSWYPVCLVL